MTCKLGVIVLAAVIAGGCSSSALLEGGGRIDPPIGDIHRNIDELDQIKYTPQACEDDRGCPIGSRCEGETCQWDCLADSDCGPNRACDARGVCRVHFTPYRSNNLDACITMDPTEKRNALLRLHDPPEDELPATCALGTGNDNDDCACGAYCNIDAQCQVDCMPAALNPPPELQCASGERCTPNGRCVPTSSPGNGPELQLMLDFASHRIAANTATAPSALIPITVRASVNSLAFLQANHPAKVKYHFAGYDDPDEEQPDGPRPLLVCASGAAPAASCKLDGGWIFHPGTTNLRADDRTIWVQIPQTATPMSWVLVGQSEWAFDVATASVAAEPVAHPTSDPGKYTGTLTWPNAGGSGLALPVEAIVTANDIALFEPTKMLLPDGHVVLPRDGQRVTQLAWLRSAVTGSAARYDVWLDLGASTYSSTTGRLAAPITLNTSTGTLALSLALDRTGNATSAACTAGCGTGTYCNPEMNLCLPAAGVFDGSIVSRGAATASTQLASEQAATWLAAAPSITALNPALLGGAGPTGIAHAYCYAPGETLAASFGLTPTLMAPSQDFGCVQGSLAGVHPYPQTTFPFANRSIEVTLDAQNRVTFNLLDACLADLSVVPASPVTPEILGSRDCASLARFFVAMNANAGQSGNEYQMRLVTQLMRQWIGLSTYVATGMVKNREYDEALAHSTETAEARLGRAVDAVDRGLRLLLDPAIRPQFAGGAAWPAVAVAPDYRTIRRPIARWNFNTTSSPVPDAEGTASAFTATGGVLASNALISTRGGSTCRSSGPDVGVGDRSFTIAFEFRSAIFGGPVKVFEKVAPNGQAIWVEVTGDPATANLTFALKDSSGGAARFPTTPFVTDGNWGLFAFVADGSDYRLYLWNPSGLQTYVASIVDNGGPRWGAAGPVSLQCNFQEKCDYNVCTSWDLNVVGDKLNPIKLPDSETFSGPYTCNGTTISCSGNPGSIPYNRCQTDGANWRAAQIPGIPLGAPQAALDAFTVIATPQIASPDGGAIRNGIVSVQYGCSLLSHDKPWPGTQAKPVCGCSAASRAWAPWNVIYDELSVWNRPLGPEELTMIASRFVSTTDETLPPRDANPAPGKEQAAGLATHMLDAVGADLALLADYLHAERGISYQECYAGGASPARDRARDRAGKNLRLMAVIEGEAARLASASGASTAPWFARYQETQKVIAGARANALFELKQLDQCRNPLGISEEELPLFIGQADGAVAKYFASTHFLTAQAHLKIDEAIAARERARTAYNEQVVSDFQRNLAPAEQTAEIEKLKVSYEATLRRYCGALVGQQDAQHPLLDALLAGTLDATNCYFKVSAPGCTGVTADTLLGDVPVACLRGELGEKLIAMKSAAIDAANAQHNVDRATEQYHVQRTYCDARKADGAERQELLAKHQATMSAQRHKQRGWSAVGGFVTAVLGTASKDWAAFARYGQQLIDQDFAQDNEAFEDAYQAEQLKFNFDQQDKACNHEAENLHFAVLAAGDVISRAGHQSSAAAFALRDAQEELAALARQAAGDIGRQAKIDRTPPQLHFWLANHIATYKRKMAFARRLTYLAVRAYEYESQLSSVHRGTALTARDPDALDAIVDQLDAVTLPLSGQGFQPGESHLVLSLRDEILKIENVAAALNRKEGDPPLTPGQVFSKYISSDASRIYNADGSFRGHGIRFSLKPDFWNDGKYAERLWRIVPLVVKDGQQPNHREVTLMQMNAFGSKLGQTPNDLVKITRAGAPTNLIADDDSANAVALSPMTTDILPTAPSTVTSRPALDDLPMGAASNLAGRGLYGDYILLFPTSPNPCSGGVCSGWSEDVMPTVNDVLLRFEIVYSVKQ